MLMETLPLMETTPDLDELGGFLCVSAPLQKRLVALETELGELRA